ncbi:MAG TPA: hypothetical protein VJW75_10145, partial [Candidatus Eisenbacteria bacterium]|nr:hypothetical protein [Candidatus Eisenbacteria bacterium]
RPVIAFGRGGAAEVVAPETGVLYLDEGDDALAAAIAEFERRSFDAVALRSHALSFARDAYRGRMDRLLRDAWEAFEARDGDPWGLERMVATADDATHVRGIPVLR